MTKALVIAVSNGCKDGYGDLLFALKLSAQLKKCYTDSGQAAPAIYLVSEKSGQETIQALKGDVEFNVAVLTTEELENEINSKKIEVVKVIEGPVFSNALIQSVNRAVQSQSEKIPLIMIPEYAFGGDDYAADIAPKETLRGALGNLIHADTLYSGFNVDAGERGILYSVPNQLDKSARVNKLDDKITKALPGISQYGQYELDTELSMQYSHDKYAEFGPTPASHFLKIHCELYKQPHKESEKNQDVIMVGAKTHKRAALEDIKDKLIENGYQRISFYNADTSDEETLYDSGSEGKAYRVIYTNGMSHESMMACTALSGPLAGATGDQSFAECIEHDKYIVYEQRDHKKSFIGSYDKEVTPILEDDLDFVGMDTQRAMELLRIANSDEEYEELGDLLRKDNVREKFIESNEGCRKKFDLSIYVANVGLGWKPTKVASCLIDGKPQEALKYAQEGNVCLFANINGKSILQHAKEHDADGTFVQFFKSPERAAEQFFSSLGQDEAFNFLHEVTVNPCSTPIEGKTIFAKAIELQRYDLVNKIIDNASEEDKKGLVKILQSKCSSGETYQQRINNDAVSLQKSLPKQVGAEDCAKQVARIFVEASTKAKDAVKEARKELNSGEQKIEEMQDTKAQPQDPELRIPF